MNNVYHHYDMYGRYSHSSDTLSDRCTEVAPPEFSVSCNWNDLEWILAPNVQTSIAFPVSSA